MIHRILVALIAVSSLCCAQDASPPQSSPTTANQSDQPPVASDEENDPFGLLAKLADQKRSVFLQKQQSLSVSLRRVSVCADAPIRKLVNGLLAAHDEYMTAKANYVSRYSALLQQQVEESEREIADNKPLQDSVRSDIENYKAELAKAQSQREELKKHGADLTDVEKLVVVAEANLKNAQDAAESSGDEEKDLQLQKAQVDIKKGMIQALNEGIRSEKESVDAFYKDFIAKEHTRCIMKQSMQGADDLAPSVRQQTSPK
jgi:hypothetical protein